MKIQTILDQIDMGSMALPKFQRGYVWNRDQVRSLMHSLYRAHPVGSLLIWVTKSDSAEVRGDAELPPGSVKLLLDGQQRMTTLYGLIRGKAPKFFEGNKRAFIDLYFNLNEEVFEFYAPVKMKDNPFWISVTDLMQKGVASAIQDLMKNPDCAENINDYINRINAIHNIKDIDIHIDEVTGEDKNVDVVVDIFNRVNSGGTKLSKGDLALAKICAEWGGAREEMQRRLTKWKRAGFYFKLEWLLRNINTIATGEALFSAMKDMDTPTFERGLKQAESSIDYILNLIAGRLGLDHDQVLGSRYSFPVMTRYLIQRGGKLTDHREQDKLLYWYINCFLWGRYAGSTESVMNQDLGLIEDLDGALDRLINHLRRNRGDLRISPLDFKTWSRGARFYPLLYMLTRVMHSVDWESTVELSNHLLGKTTSLQVHHIFPKSKLYKYGYEKAEVNTLANFTFLTQETNLIVSNRDPEEYFEYYVENHPGALESHWIPMDRSLWSYDKYPDFVAARRDLLAEAANTFLTNLYEGAMPKTAITEDITERKVLFVPGGVEDEEEERLIKDFNNWVVMQGLPDGEYMYELVDENTGERLANVDLAWPNGLQEGFSQPVALLINEESDTEKIVNDAGYRFFTDVDKFRQYIASDILALRDEMLNA